MLCWSRDGQNNVNRNLSALALVLALRIRTLAGYILAGAVILVMWGLLNHYAVWSKLQPVVS